MSRHLDTIATRPTIPSLEIEAPQHLKLGIGARGPQRRRARHPARLRCRGPGAASTARCSPSAQPRCRSPATRCARARCIDQEALSDDLRELFRTSGLSKRVRDRRRQPAHRAAHARAATRHRPQGTRRGRPLPGPGSGADAARQRRARLPSARHHRHARRPRQRVVLVAAQRDMVERLLGAVRRGRTCAPRESTCPPSR